MNYLDTSLLPMSTDLARSVHGRENARSPIWRPPAQLHFAVSQDEEHVFLCIEHGGELIKLGERIHHYPLLVLARLRLEDMRRGLEPANQGWVDLPRLASMLGIDSAYLNIQIFRARRQIAKTSMTDAETIEIVERRRGQIRLGDFAIRIVHGSTVEAGP